MITLIGTLGASIILIFFLLGQLRKIDVDSIWYDGCNFIGSAMLVLYAYLLSSIPFFILNMVWALVSLKDILRYSKKTHGSQGKPS